MNFQLNLKSIWQLLKKEKKPLILGQLATLIAIIVSVPIPLLLPKLVDEVLLEKPDLFVSTIDTAFGSGSPLYYIVVVAFAVIFLRFFYFGLTVVVTKIFTAVSKNVIYDIRVKVLEYLKKVSMNEYESLGSGSVGANLITDVNTLDAFIVTSSGKLAASALTVLAIAGVMIVIHPVLGILILVFQPLIMILSKKIAKSVKDLKRDENLAIEDFQEEIGETLELFGQIKASNKEHEFFGRSIDLARKIKETSNNYGYKSVAAERFSFTLFLSVFEILRATGLVLVAYSDLSIGMMFAMFGYIWFIMTPIQDLLSIQYSYASAKAAMERINKIFTLKTEKTGTRSLTGNKVDIEITNLSFSYNKEKEVLQNISMKIPHKEKIALIGASGSGKTTLALLLAGFYQKDSGEILYNDTPVESLKKQSLRESVFLVLQMPILFNDTLRFNITMGNDSVSDDEIFRALEIAQLKDTVDAMKEGLNTVVGRHGIRLSGGQRQRLSIARMIVANPKVVIFDESTSALDVHVEALIFEALKPILEDKTVITIAHRLSTVKNADKVFVIHEGRIVQEGGHKELEETEGHYLEFVKKQLI